MVPNQWQQCWVGWFWNRLIFAIEWRKFSIAFIVCRCFFFEVYNTLKHNCLRQNDWTMKCDSDGFEDRIGWLKGRIFNPSFFLVTNQVMWILPPLSQLRVTNVCAFNREKVMSFYTLFGGKLNDYINDCLALHAEEGCVLLPPPWERWQSNRPGRLYFLFFFQISLRGVSKFKPKINQWHVLWERNRVGKELRECLLTNETFYFVYDEFSPH